MKANKLDRIDPWRNSQTVIKAQNKSRKTAARQQTKKEIKNLC